MNFSDFEQAALQLNARHEQFELKRWARMELALGFTGQVCDLAELLRAHAGVQTIDGHQAKLGHELSECL